MPYAHFYALAILALVLLTSGLAGCSLTQPDNPSFPLSTEQGIASLNEMARRPRAPVRPVVFCGGWGGSDLTRTQQFGPVVAALGNHEVVVVNFNGCADFAACRERLLDAVYERFPDHGQPGSEAETVDVLGISMGGLVSRYAALPPEHGGEPDRRLHINTLYGIAIPHNGLGVATLGFWDKRVRQMGAGSDIHQQIDQGWPDATYRIVDYVRLGDGWVGATHAQGPDEPLRWVPNIPGQDPHHGFFDPRIMADIARRMRGETPHTLDPPAPLP